MIIVGLLQETGPLGEAVYLAHTKALQTRYAARISVAKTTERIICTRQEPKMKPASFDAHQIETVKYLGTIRDSQVSFYKNTGYTEIYIKY